MPPKKAIWSENASINNDTDHYSRISAHKAGPDKRMANPTSVPGLTDYAEIQHNEVEALRSIYFDEFEDVAVKPAAWSVC